MNVASALDRRVERLMLHATFESFGHSSPPLARFRLLQNMKRAQWPLGYWMLQYLQRTSKWRALRPRQDRLHFV